MPVADLTKVVLHQFRLKYIENSFKKQKLTPKMREQTKRSHTWRQEQHFGFRNKTKTELKLEQKPKKGFQIVTSGLETYFPHAEVSINDKFLDRSFC